jgi:hypothetical protein
MACDPAPFEGVWAVVGAVGRTSRRARDLRAALRLHPRHEGRQVDRQGPGEPLDIDHAHVAAATLDVADVARVETGLLRETFLREPAL